MNVSRITCEDSNVMLNRTRLAIGDWKGAIDRLTLKFFELNFEKLKVFFLSLTGLWGSCPLDDRGCTGGNDKTGRHLSCESWVSMCGLSDAVTGAVGCRNHR